MPVATHPPTLAELSDALVGAAPDLDDLGRRIVLATYRLLGTGRPVTEVEVAAEVGSDQADISRRLGAWPGVFRDGQGAVVGFWGLAIAPLDPEYRLRRAAGPDLYAWCAWDTLFLPALLGETLEVSVTDAQSGDPVRLTVTPDGVQSLDPAGSTVSFLVPDGKFDADVVVGFCHKVLFFSNPHNAASWIESQPDQLFTLSVAEAFEVGRRVVRGRYGDALTD